MLPTDEMYGGWPYSGEIDIMEAVGFDHGTIHATAHCETYNWWNGQPPPSTRKYSTLICLTDGGSYDGGDVELIVDEVKTMKLNMGDVLIYPSFIPIRFLPITRGKLVLFKLFSNGNAYV